MRYFTAFLFLLTLVYSDSASPRYENLLLSQDAPAQCLSVKSNGNAYIEIVKNHLERDAKVPVFIYAFDDFLKFDNIPFPQDWDSLTPHDLIKDGKFGVKVKSDAGPVDYVNAHISADDKSVKFDVKNSGLYCVYTPPVSPGYEFVIIEKNSGGYLPYIEGINYSQLKISFVVMLVVCIWLLRDLIRSVGKNFSNLNNISVISKCAVFYVLLPYLVITSFTLICDFALNHMKVKGFLAVSIRSLIDVLRMIFMVGVNTLLLCFCMGYGVLYYREQTKTFREFPRSNLKLVKIFAALQLASFSGMVFCLMFDEKLFGIAVGVVGGVQLIVFFATLYFAWKTSKHLKEFPPYPTSVENYGEKNQSLRTAFKRSLFLLITLPFLGSFIANIYSAFRTVDSLNLDLENVDDKYFQYKLLDVWAKDSFFYYIQIATSSVLALISLVGVFFIWIKNNEGLVIDEAEKYHDSVYVDEEADNEVI